MRGLGLTALTLGVGACSAPGALTATPLPPPVPGFDLVGPAVAFQGEPVQITAQLPVPPAPPNGVTVWLPSTDGPQGAGTCHPALLGGCLDIVGILTVHGPATTVAGAATFHVAVDPAHATSDLSFQGVVRAAGQAFLSTPLTLTVLAPPPLFGVDGSGLWAIDPLSGAGTLVGSTGVLLAGIDVCAAQGLAIQALYGVERVRAGTSDLLQVDPTTGATTVIGNTGFQITAMACDPAAGRLFGLTSAGELVDISIFSGQGTIVGNPGLVGAGGLAWVAEAGSLYAIDGTDTLYQLDARTFAPTAAASTGFADLRGLAAHSDSLVLYAASGLTGELVQIDLATGQGTAIGPLPGGVFEGLGF